jgi:hypothetical protein
MKGFQLQEQLGIVDPHYKEFVCKMCSRYYISFFKNKSACNINYFELQPLNNFRTAISGLSHAVEDYFIGVLLMPYPHLYHLTSVTVKIKEQRYPCNRTCKPVGL